MRQLITLHPVHRQKQRWGHAGAQLSGPFEVSLEPQPGEQYLLNP